MPELRALLPCPFCGGKAAFERTGTSRRSCIVVCEECSCNLETGEIWSSGIAWNTRRSDAEIERLRHIIGALVEWRDRERTYPESTEKAISVWDAAREAIKPATAEGE